MSHVTKSLRNNTQSTIGLKQKYTIILIKFDIDTYIQKLQILTSQLTKLDKLFNDLTKPFHFNVKSNFSFFFFCYKIVLNLNNVSML